ncbi:methionine sulfoxide reductase [Candidatus Uabimicrobium amorphum]|uniref:peptide-methionine (S)-S-oxide reductase n=1 Tax=Uabimicrobium amorphum TaxID=2596890 RepID=A0A5S9F5F5_UABAM|nr:methionine sulfoxide reductase [Candidatus Uabimicrobium amorphum]
MGDHIETLEVDYDSQVVSFADLLEVFWKSRRHDRPPYSRQYKSAIFPHTQEQSHIVQETQKAYKKKYQVSYVEVIEKFTFYMAEDYHQKYWLQHTPFLLMLFYKVYKDDLMPTLFRSTVAARVNGYIRGYGKFSQIQAEFPKFNWPQEKQQEILAFLEKRDL